MRYQIKIVVLLFFLSAECSVAKLQKQGSVNPTDFYTKQSFQTFKGVIEIEAKFEGSSKIFLFDTGADINLIQRDSLAGKKSKYSGASKRKMELGKEKISKLKIGEVEFLDTYALHGDFVGLKEQIPQFGGLIGQSIISKANWLINYQI